MRIVIMRHGEAVEEDVDPGRPLSARGKAQARAVGLKLRALGVGPLEIVHSTKARARETAEALALALGSPPPREQAGLLPEDPIEPVVRELLDRGTDQILVGHLPFVRRLAAVLLSTNFDVPPFGLATALVLDREEATGELGLTAVL